MKVTLEDYTPLGTEVLLKPQIKTHSEGGLILGKEKTDRWFEVVKKGGLVDPTIHEGDFVIFDIINTMQMHLEFGGERYIQVNVHSVKGIVTREVQLSNNITVT